MGISCVAVGNSKIARSTSRGKGLLQYEGYGYFFLASRCCGSFTFANRRTLLGVTQRHNCTATVVRFTSDCSELKIFRCPLFQHHYAPLV